MREEPHLKRIHPTGVASALERAHQYRLLNQPHEAESICLDVLEVEPENQKALICLILALTDQFSARGFGHAERRARELLPRLEGAYERLYYAAIIAERRAKTQRRMAVMRHVVYEGLREAMDLYEQAEKMQPEDCEDVILRWNACARVIQQDSSLVPESHPDEPYEPYLE
jgi:hypothetical protein